MEIGGRLSDKKVPSRRKGDRGQWGTEMTEISYKPVKVANEESFIRQN